MKTITLIAIAILTAAPAFAHRAPKDIGPQPTFPEWQAAIDARLQTLLLDYSSAKIEYVPETAARDDGWFACFGINPKNQMGGYTGWQTAQATYDTTTREVRISFNATQPWDAATCKGRIERARPL